jgi:hypothetical protein
LEFAVVSTYTIRRLYQDPDLQPDIIKTGLSLEEAQGHCNDPETSSETATSNWALALTVAVGPWFDGYFSE